MIKKAYTLLDVLIVLFIMASMMLVFTSHFYVIDDSHLHFLNQYFSLQCKSITQREDNYLNGIHFNKEGHVDKARTLNFGKHTVIVHLGNGFISYE